MENYDAVLAAIAEFIDYMGEPENALAVWIAASGILAGAYLAAPILDI